MKYRAKTNLNLRSEASANSRSVVVMPKGTILTRDGISKPWIRGTAVVRGKRYKGWAHGDYLDYQEPVPVPKPPVVTEPTTSVPKQGPVDAVVKLWYRLRPGYTPGWALTQAGRKKRYGASESAVRKQLVKRHWKGKNFLIHKLEVDRFDAFTDEVDAYEKAHAKNYKLIEVWTMCWRTIKNSSTLSNHSFGIAWDVNPSQNPWQSKLKTDLPKYWLAAAARQNIRWGGLYHSSKDAMHFEL